MDDSSRMVSSFDCSLNEVYTVMPPITSLEMADQRFSSNKIPSLATGKMGNDLKLFLSAISVRLWLDS